jgi:hypothetical protein
MAVLLLALLAAGSCSTAPHTTGTTTTSTLGQPKEGPTTRTIPLMAAPHNTNRTTPRTTSEDKNKTHPHQEEDKKRRVTTTEDSRR